SLFLYFFFYFKMNYFFFSSRRRHTRSKRDWSSDVCSSDLGSNGVFAKHKDKYYKVDIPKIQVVNPVGSGDSMIAGFASALINKATNEEILKKANTLGMLNAQETVTGYINLKNYDDLYNKIKIIEV